MAVEQLVLPTQCRAAILKLAHSIPMAGHLGKTKTASRILQRFYWPTLFEDVGTYCKSCTECQKEFTPSIPMPILEELSTTML